MSSPSTPRAAASFESISLEPNPVIEAYKADVDMTLVHENLRLSVDDRIKKMIKALELAEEIRKSARARP